jgi:hypothetical protein
MPLGDIAGEVIGGILRFIAQIIVEIFFEILIKGPGYLIVRIFRPRESIDADGAAVILVGVCFWVVVLLGGYFAYTAISDAGA